MILLKHFRAGLDHVYSMIGIQCTNFMKGLHQAISLLNHINVQRTWPKLVNQIQSSNLMISFLLLQFIYYKKYSSPGTVLSLSLKFPRIIPVEFLFRKQRRHFKNFSRHHAHIKRNVRRQIQEKSG